MLRRRVPAVAYIHLHLSRPLATGVLQHSVHLFWLPYIFFNIVSSCVGLSLGGVVTVCMSVRYVLLYSEHQYISMGTSIGINLESFR